MQLRYSTVLTMMVAGSLILPATPASATGSVSSATYTLYDGCEDYAIQVNGSFPGASEWAYDVDLLAPSGEPITGDFNSGVGSAFASAVSFQICAFQGVGVYTITGTIEWHDANFAVLAAEPVSGQLTMVRQQTESTLKVSDKTPAVKSKVKFTIKSRQDTALGLRNNAEARVGLEIKCGNAWKRLPRSSTFTSVYGNAVLKYRWRFDETCRVRSVTRPTVNAAPSHSKAVKINPHR